MPSSTTGGGIADLETSYPIYCRALRILVQEGASLKQVQRTVCWARLQRLHTCMPCQYRDPERLYVLLKRRFDGESDPRPWDVL
ncbi:MAG: DUF3136 domain-containing protein [Prochlorococcaceae cyanobacterium]